MRNRKRFSFLHYGGERSKRCFLLFLE
uniref:Uncharacterized protein n=1 Tax=Arundo donax TaxID=35708 RepID=A0A0A8YDY3_ARUDO